MKPLLETGCVGRLERRIVGPIVLCGILLFLVLSFLFHGLRHDDAFITYRYAQNLAEGRGLAFNPGERIMGSTSPGHVLLSAILYLVVGRDCLPSAMSIVGCGAWTAQALALLFLLLPALGVLGACAVALVVAAGGAGSADWVALETNLAVALGLWAVVLATKGRWTGTAILSALAVLTRPDAVILALLLGLQCIWRERKHSVAPIVLFLALLSPWLVYATAWFGSPIPQSAVAKFQQTSFAAYAQHLLEHPVQRILPWAPRHLIYPFWLMVLAGAVFLVRQVPRLWVLPTYALLHGLSYLVLRPQVAHWWHLYPQVLLLAVFGMSTIAAVFVVFPKHLLDLVAGFMLLFLLLSALSATLVLAITHHGRYWEGARDEAYRHVADWLSTETQPVDVVASAEVGTIAYYSNRRMVDLAGIITPRSSASLRESPTWLVVPGHLMHTDCPRHLRPVRIFAGGDFFAYLFRMR